MKTRILCAIALITPYLLFADCPPTGLIALWQGQSNILDSIGNYDATAKGTGVTYVAAEVGTGFSFNGTSSATINCGSFTNFGTNDFTIEFWIKSTDNSFDELISKRDACLNTANFFDIRMEANGTIAFGIGGGNPTNGARNFDSLTAINNGAWHHVAAVRQQSNALLYIDGAYSTNQSQDTYIADVSNTANLKIGNGPCVSFDGTTWFSGKLDEISVYTRALSASDVLAVYSAGSSGKCCFAPRISKQPVTPQNVHTNSSTSFTVTSLGSPAPTYQWLLNYVNISGATNSSYTISSVQSTNTGVYEVIVDNPCGTATSDPIILAIAPVVTTQPANATGVLGSPAYFSAVAGGTPTITYQWRKNVTNDLNDGATYTGTDTPNLTINSVAAGNNGSYSVHVSNDGGATNSSNAVLFTPPAITGQPSSKSAFVSNNVVFSVTAAGSPTLKYQWRTNGVAISGVTTANYTISSVNSNWNGLVFSCKVTNSYGTVTSGDATLSLKGTVLVDIPAPLKTTNCLGDTRVLCVTGGAAAGSTPGYQWRHSGTDISGATSPCYTVNVTNSSVAGSYSVVVSDPYGSDTSSTASIVYYDPPNITLNPQPQAQTVVVGNPFILRANATGTAPAYSWIKDGVVVATGVTNYVVQNSALSDAGTYYFQIANFCGTSNSSNATVTVTPAYCATNLVTSLLGWWQFESNLVDFTSNYNGTSIGSDVTYTTGKPNLGIHFRGNAYGWADLGAFTNFGTNDFTVEFWINTSTTSSSMRTELLGKRGVPFGACDGQHSFFDIQLQTNGAICFNYGDTNQIGYIDMASTATVADGVFHHVACVRQGTNALVYIDGSLSGTQNPADAQIASISNTYDLLISSGPCIELYYAFFAGTLDELSIYSRALSAAEILSIFDASDLEKCTGP